MKLEWHHLPAADWRTAKARARLRFTPAPIEGDLWGDQQLTSITIDVGTAPVQQPDGVGRVWSIFHAYITIGHRQALCINNSAVPLDASEDAMAHAIRMAEEWAASFVGPAWSVDEVSR